MPKLFKLQAFLAKIETTRGVAEALTATEAIDVENVSARVELDVAERQGFKPSLGPGRHSLLNMRWVIEFDYVLRVTNSPATGSSASAEILDPIFRCCDLTPTYTAESSGGANDGNISYARRAVTGTDETATIAWYVDGIRYLAHECKGTFSGSFKSGDFARLHFVVTGKFNAPTATAIPDDIEDAFPTTDLTPCVGKSLVPDGVTHITAATTDDLDALFFFSPDVTEDCTGNGHTLTNNNGATMHDASIRGLGVSFASASSQRMSLAYNAAFDYGTGSFSVFGWFKQPDTSGGQVHLVDRRASGIGFQIYITTAGSLVFRISDDGSTFDTLTSAAAIDDDVWHFFVARKVTTASIQMDIDGVAEAGVAISAATGSISGTTPVLTLGANSTPGEYLNGEMVGLGFVSANISAAQSREDLYSWLHDFLVTDTTFDLANNVYAAKRLGGIKSVVIDGCRPVASLTIQHPILADRDLYSEILVNNPDEFLIQRKIGSGANGTVIVKLRAQPTTPSLFDMDGLAGIKIDANLVELDGETNDQFEIIFR